MQSHNLHSVQNSSLSGSNEDFSVYNTTKKIKLNNTNLTQSHHLFNHYSKGNENTLQSADLSNPYLSLQQSSATNGKPKTKKVFQIQRSGPRPLSQKGFYSNAEETDKFVHKSDSLSVKEECEVIDKPPLNRRKNKYSSKASSEKPHGTRTLRRLDKKSSNRINSGSEFNKFRSRYNTFEIQNSCFFDNTSQSSFLEVVLKLESEFESYFNEFEYLLSQINTKQEQLSSTSDVKTEKTEIYLDSGNPYPSFNDNIWLEDVSKIQSVGQYADLADETLDLDINVKDENYL